MPLLYESLSIVSWAITVKDIETDKGVPNAKICLFEGGGKMCQPPEEADYTEFTDANGVAIFNVPVAFYRVDVYVAGYESAQVQHVPSEEWKDVWTCCGAGGAPHTYPFQVKKIPGYEPPEEPKKLNLVIAGGVVVALAVIGGVLIIRRKKKKR